MKVYILTAITNHSWGEDTTIAGVYATIDAAKKAQPEDTATTTWGIEEHVVEGEA